MARFFLVVLALLYMTDCQGDYTESDLKNGKSSWSESLIKYNTSNYVYQLQRECSNDVCSECSKQQRYVLVNNNEITMVQYSDQTDNCLQTEPINTFDEYLTIEQWFDLVTKNIKRTENTQNHDSFIVTYDMTNGYPNYLYINNSITITMYCLSFLNNDISLNSGDWSYCYDYESWKKELIIVDDDDMDDSMDSMNSMDDSMVNMDDMDDSMDSMANIDDDNDSNDNNEGNNANSDNQKEDSNEDITSDTKAGTNCDPVVVEKDDCTEWLYVYMTTIICFISSILFLLCYWMYYGQEISAESKGYKKSKTDQFETEESDDSIDEIMRKKNKRKRDKKKKKILKLLDDIPENIHIPKAKGFKKKKGNSYGSVALTDPDMDDDDQDQLQANNDWEFVNDNNAFGASQSDDTVDEEDDDDDDE